MSSSANSDAAAWPRSTSRTGIAAACGECWEVAEAHFERAASEASAIWFVVSEVDVRRWRRLGMPWRLRLCEALLRESAL
ncbi:MAG: hypothetical protein JWL61_1880 [Gemmatimonadetes bacterium]|nr:hypothetical protein [Gemmatimonadota bacterium]